MTKTIRLKLDDVLLNKLDELADFHGASAPDTLRLLIRYGHFDMQQFVETEFGPNGEKAPPNVPQPDDEIPTACR